MPRFGSSAVSANSNLVARSKAHVMLFFQDSHYPSSMESLLEPPSGSQRVKFRGAGSDSPYDFTLDSEYKPIDVSLVLPHYRAKNQPVDYRLDMFVGNECDESIKVKVVSKIVSADSHGYS